jgi:tetratricopeptide (TPR) repeat protein
VGCIHQQKFFHRDVKPHNIMLRQDRGEAVLIDFGIAKEFVDLETIYLSNSLGTELYKPIEQYEKRGQFGAYTDIYALAVTLYHLLTGASPGGGSPLYTSKARKDAQDNGGGEQIEKCLWEKLANSGVSKSTQAAIKAGMEIEPNQRPQTITAFRELLSGLANKNVSVKAKIDESDGDVNWMEHGDNLFKLRKYEAAITSCDFALEIEPSNFIVWHKRGNSLNELRRYEEAIASYDRALKIDSNNPNIWHERGNSLHQLGKYEEAIISFNRALKIDPNNSTTWCSRGAPLHQLGKYEEAIISFNRALKIDPNNSSTWCSRGAPLHQLGKYEEAIISFDRALKIDPNNSTTWYWHGLLLDKLEKYEEAIDSFDRALKIDPNNSTVSKNRQIAINKLANYKKSWFSKIFS